MVSRVDISSHVAPAVALARRPVMNETSRQNQRWAVHAHPRCMGPRNGRRACICHPGEPTQQDPHRRARSRV